MIARLEPVISEMEREGESIVIVGHQAVLRVIFGYLMAQVKLAAGCTGRVVQRLPHAAWLVGDAFAACWLHRR